MGWIFQRTTVRSLILLVLLTTGSCKSWGKFWVLADLKLLGVRDNGVIESGFLTGTVAADAGVLKVEVALDGGSYSEASGTAVWLFKLPTGANTWRDGTKHTIAVRSLHSDNSYSDPITVTVRKGMNKDINGDGFPDTAVGANLRNAGAGASQGTVYIFHGSASGIKSTSAATANTVIDGQAASDQFGYGIAIGDVNGDGYGDLIASAAVRNAGLGANQGVVYVFHSTGSSGIVVTTAGSASTTIAALASGDNLGTGVSVGDVNGDGYADVIAGAGNRSSSQGATFIFHSTGAAGVTATGAGSASTTITGMATSNFGKSVATGDINGDGFADVIAGGNNTGGGAYVFHSSGSGGVTITTAGTASRIITPTVTSDGFGVSVGTGDVNGDGYADLVVGAYNRNAGAGATQGVAYVFHSAGSSGLSTSAAASANTIIAGQGAGDSLGLAVATGDINGDGFADVLAGAPSRNAGAANQGAVYAFLSGGSGGITVASANNANTIIVGAASANLGQGLGSLDINGDGFFDIVGGASAGNAVYVFHSAGTIGISASSSSAANTSIAGQTAGDAFGTWVSR